MGHISSSSVQCEFQSSDHTECPSKEVETEKRDVRRVPQMARVEEEETVMDIDTPSSSPRKAPKCYDIRVNRLFYKLPQSTWQSIFTRRVHKQDDKTHMGTAMELSKEQAVEPRYILRDISCEAKSGELLAIAGPSGAGKSTLVEVLAGRIRPTSPSPASGCVFVNNQKMDAGQFRRVSGYVMQDDALFPSLTVLETLLFSARLRLPASMSMTMKRARVEALLDELGLQDVADARIGNEIIRGISGGEKRRVSIGVDVIHDPSVLLLDEPTSGLDSAAAMNIVAMLRSMADCPERRCTVVLTIHQPNFRILQLMNSILLLAEGRVVHYGTLELLAARLDLAGHIIPAQVNVLEYAIEVVNSTASQKTTMATTSGRISFSVDFRLEEKTPQDCRSLHENHVRIVVDPGKAFGFLGENWKENPDLPRQEEVDDEDLRVWFANSCSQEILILAHRYFTTLSRSKVFFKTKSLQALGAGTVLGTIFFKAGTKNQNQGVQERFGFLAYALTFFMSGSTEALAIFLQERQILMRETSRGAYRISSYVLSNALVFAPFLFVMSLLYCIPAYTLAALNPTTTAFLFFALVMWLVMLMANSFVAFFSAVVPNFISGNSLIQVFIGAFFLFSGYFIAKDSIPRYWIFMHYLSLFKYPLDALLINEYAGRSKRCFGSMITNNSSSTSSGERVCSLTGEEVLSSAGIGQHQWWKWANVAIMVAFVIFYRFLSYIAVCFRLTSHSRRWPCFSR